MSTENTPEDMETETTANNEASEKPKQKCLMIYTEPVTWEDVISPEVQAFAKKALRFHVSLQQNKETGIKVGGTRFIFAEQKDSDEVKEYMEPLIKKNSEMHKIRMKLATGMVYLSDANGSNQILKLDNRNVFIKNLPECANVDLLKIVFPNAKDISIMPVEEGKEGRAERTGLIRCKTTPEARAYVERGDGILINDTEIHLVRPHRTPSNKRRPAYKNTGRNSGGSGSNKRSSGAQLPGGGELYRMVESSR